MKFAHQVRYPGRTPTLWSNLWLLISTPGLWVLAAHRLAHFTECTSRSKLLCLPLKALVCVTTYLTQVFTKCYILPSTTIAPGIYLGSGGHIILGAATVGSGTIIHHCVTVGMSVIDSGIPDIGRDVWIGPNCVIYGAIRVADGVTILPDTVLTKKLPPRVVVKGNPGLIVRRDYDNGALRHSCDLDLAYQLSTTRVNS
jgi:serine acetyltransferase